MTATLTSPGQGITRKELRQQVARYFGYFRGTATGGSTTTVADTTETHEADYWNGAWVFIDEADGASPEGSQARITDYSGTVITCTTLPAAVQAGDTYEVYFRVSPSEINQAINEVTKGQPVILDLTPDTTGYDYVLLGDGLTRKSQVRSVWWRDSSDSDSPPIQILDWRIDQDNEALTLWLSFQPDSDDLLWIEYLAGPGGLHDDATRVNIPASYIRMATITRILENMLMQQDEAGTQRIGTLLRDARDQLARETIQYPPPPAKARTTNWMRRSRKDRLERLLGEIGI
jgi:hypothetical protein